MALARGRIPEGAWGRRLLFHQACKRSRLRVTYRNRQYIMLTRNDFHNFTS
jgi:hypothetical protein